MQCKYTSRREARCHPLRPLAGFPPGRASDGAPSSFATRNHRGFSLIELLAVMAIIIMMMGLLLPSLAGWGSVAGRRGAVNIVMNTLEQARVAALESGQTVYVGFADADFPTEDMRYSSFFVFRDATEEEKAATPNAPKYVILKKWTRLPKNIAFKSQFPGGTKSVIQTSTAIPDLNDALPNLHRLSDQDGNIPVIKFNSSGAVEGNNQPIFLYEGYFANGQDNYTRNSGIQNSSAGLFEKISISRYTGRVQLDVTGT